MCPYHKTLTSVFSKWTAWFKSSNSQIFSIFFMKIDQIKWRLWPKLYQINLRWVWRLECSSLFSKNKCPIHIVWAHWIMDNGRHVHNEQCGDSWWMLGIFWNYNEVIYLCYSCQLYSSLFCPVFCPEKLRMKSNEYTEVQKMNKFWKSYFYVMEN